MLFCICATMNRSRIVVLVFILTTQLVWDSHQALLKEKCAQNNDCLIGYSVCSTGVCECDTGYTVDSGKKLCLINRLNLNDNCEETSQCKVDGSACDARKCKCQSDWITSGERCLIKKTTLGDVCEIDDQCAIDGSFCTGAKVCACRETNVASGNGCLQRIKSIENQVCREDVQCPENSLCSISQEKRTCKCKSGFVKDSEGLACLKVVNAIGTEICKDDLQCPVGSSCSNIGGIMKCNCKTGYIESSDKSACLKEVSRLGDTCQESTQCKVEKSLCLKQVCTCSEEAPIEIENECLKSVKSIGDGVCKGDKQCPSKSTCLNTKCNCIEGFVKNSQGMSCLEGAKKLGDECVENGQCTLYLENTQCKVFNESLSCECKSGFVPNSNKTTCIATKNLGGDCDESVQCESGQTCENGKCTCNLKSHVVNNGTCLEKKKLGDPCVNRMQCVLDDGKIGRTTCLNNCTCSPPYKQDAGKNICSSGVREVAACALVTFVLLAHCIFANKN